MRFLSVFIAIVIIFSVLHAPAALAISASDTQAQLEQELKDIEAQIAQYTAELSKTQTEKKTLANKIKQLQTKQKSLALQIKSTTLQLTTLKEQIVMVEKNIQSNLTRQKKLHSEIGLLLRQMNAVDENVVITLFSANGLSDAFNRVQNYLALASAVGDLAAQNKIIRAQLQDNQEKLADKKNDTANLLSIQSIQQQGLSANLGEQNQLLTETKGKESNYQTILADKKKRAAEIRNRIYELFNTGKTITFGQAVDIAKWVAGATGVRAAFLLAVLTQESNLGKNVGTCNRSGDPESKSWKVIMKPERDHEPFKTITSELGLDINTTPVSCPMKDKNGNQVGWGGAMGPAQFIPSTWMGYRNKVTALTGKSTANPWDIRDAFVAAAIKLRADGADGTDDGEWKAAMRYFSGGTNTKYRFYGDNVLATTKKYLQDIADL